MARYIGDLEGDSRPFGGLCGMTDARRDVGESWGPEERGVMNKRLLSIVFFLFMLCNIHTASNKV